ncbi:MAG: ribosome-associated translation inhibitor RaiA [Oscillospiraceae bacterium]|jgi:putative sigma-54 modulation protein|nr:ribosome-associated translation inhibitor RaiA [Oscillospiraceae bacterium]
MNVKVTAKKMQADGLAEYAESKLKKLERFFGEDFDAKITMSAQRGMITLEITAQHDNLTFRAEQSAQNKNDALDACVDRIVRQIRKNKTKIEKRLNESAFKTSFEDDVEEQATYEVLKKKPIILHPMNVDEAILQMNMLSHSFFMFKNGDTGEINVVYKRKDGHYAVLEPTKD